MVKTYVTLFCILLSSFTPQGGISLVHSDIVNVDALQPFFTKLSEIKAKKSTVSIVHIGDSHIQADFLSGTVRKKLQNTFGNAGRGFVFPYKIAQSGGALDVRFNHTGTWQYCYIKKRYEACNIGVAGFTVSPNGDASVTIDVESKAQTDAAFNKITFLDNYGSFLPTSAIGSFAPMKENNHTVIYFDELQEKLEFKPAFEKNRMPELQGMILENGRPGLLYHAFGINGSTVSQYLRGNAFSKQISDLNASLAIISFGTNDGYTTTSRFCKTCLKEEYRTLIHRIRSKNPDIAILLTTPPDHYFNRKYPNSNTASIRDALYELSTEESVALWDLYEAMGGKNAIAAWQKEDLARGDLIHFTIPGYELQGDLLYQALMRAFKTRE